MKTTIAITLFFVCIFSFAGYAQEKYGNTLNLGLGVGGYSGYYGYLGRTVPVLHINYEFDVAKNFTLAPFISFYSYRSDYYYNGNNNRYYLYRETVIPIGIKGTYYFDELLEANSNWDFYLAGSLGYAIVSTRWDNGYTGNRNMYTRPNLLFLDIHIGTEYHFNNKAGVFFDLSSGVSTIGLAIHTTK